MYKYTDYKELYGRIMQFGKNKLVPIHRWYPFVEGYSKEFIESILAEQERTINVCLEPFSGSGTTSLELQEKGIQCYATEVNPFMFTLSRAKINAPKFKVKKINEHKNIMRSIIREISINDIQLQNNFPTLVENDEKDKWNLDTNVYVAIKKIKYVISLLKPTYYRDLYTIALASILPNVSNLYRNGKCLSYKKGWQKTTYSEEAVIDMFLNVINDIFLEDIQKFAFEKKIDNSKFLYKGDARKTIDKKVPDDSIDLIITSPPYLNSRDYTDSYMLELKALGYVNDYDDIIDLRKQTIRSHVQLKWKEGLETKNTIVNETVKAIKANILLEGKTWSEDIPNMVVAYFVDMENLFNVFYRKMKMEGKIYFNVSNSAYNNTLIDTIEIIANIAESIGFRVVEIRKARYLKTSPQQKETIGKLLEAVLVLEKR